MSAIEALTQTKLSFSDLMAAITELDTTFSDEKAASIGVSANITTDLLTPAFKKNAYLNGTKATVIQGDFDSHLDNVRRFASTGVTQLLLINFFDNLLPSFEAQIEFLKDAFINELKTKVMNELRLVLSEAKSFKRVFIGTFHTFGTHSATDLDAHLEQVVSSFNEILSTEILGHANVTLISLEKIVARIGERESYNSRFYFQFKAPYTLSFWDELSRQIFLKTHGDGSYFYKALVLDCDNTLWGGIIGEDLLHGIKLSPHDYPGNVFWLVQQEILKLQKRGVLICLCSKNNAADVEEVLNNHPHQVINGSHIILKKLNWESKPENLKALVKELNIGLDSLVFVDDSAFECEAVRSQLPMVKTIQVPKNIFEYPAAFQKVAEFFPTSNSGSIDKTELYKLRQLAIEEEKRFSNQDEYLASLELKAELRLNPKDSISRIAELSNKSNQFNLTTLRLTEDDVAKRTESDGSFVYSIDVSDKFGKHGLTGVVLAHASDADFVVENFLMSCRVIGRGIEFAFWPQILADAKRAGCKTVSAKFLKSEKNSMVQDFYDRLGFPLRQETDVVKTYSAPIDELKLTHQSHVEVEYVQ